MSTTSPASELTVAILPIGEISPWQIELTKLVLHIEFGVKTIILPAMAMPSQYYNKERDRYQAPKILDILFSQLPAGAQRIMGISEGRLEFSDTISLNGCADSCDGTAIYSTRPWFDNRLFNDLFSYHVIVHEFGHTLGLQHCAQPQCALITGRFNFNVVLCARCRRWANRELMVRPGSAEERFSRAEALRRHGYFPEAIAAYQEAIARAPLEPHYYSGLIRTLYIVEKKNDGLRAIEKSVKLSGESDDLYYNTGVAYLQNQAPVAEKYFNKAIITANDPRAMHRFVGNAYRDIAHDVKQASRYYKEFLRLGGHDPEIVEWLVSRSQL